MSAKQNILGKLRKSLTGTTPVPDNFDVELVTAPYTYTAEQRIPHLRKLMDAVHTEPLEKVTDHVWRSRHSVSFNWFLISESGKAMVIDYGYRLATFAWPNYPKSYTRRALLHGLDGLKKQFGIDRVDVALISHFHDDHVCGVPVLQRLFGTECWAAENFADLLERLHLRH